MSILLLGAKGLAGSAVNRFFKKFSKKKLLSIGSRSELDLRDYSKLKALFEDNDFEGVIICAARVGGIGANQNYPFEFLSENLTIQNNIFEMVKLFKTRRVIFLGSSCIYPTNTPIPIREEYLSLDGVHPLHEPYAIAKMAGFKAAEYLNLQYGLDCRCLMPTNLFGPNDNYHKVYSHVVPALIRKVSEAVENKNRKFVIWGTGTVLRDVLYSDDLASAIFKSYFASQTDWQNAIEGGPGFLNVGSGCEHTVLSIAKLISEIFDYKGDIEHDLSKPDGTTSKLLDITRIRKLGWQPEYSIRDALIKTINDYNTNKSLLRR